MIKVEVIENFSLKDFDKIQDLERATSKNDEGKLYVRDTFKCDEKMVDYLTGNNAIKKVVVKVIEVEPEKTIEERIEDIRKMDVGEPIPKEKLEKAKKEFELKPKKKTAKKK